jgi:putative RecB family exonuclease
MALALPRTLTPSKVTAFTNCPLAFRYSVIEHRPEPPSPHAVKGTLVHSALEGLFWNHAPAGRTRAAAGHELARAWHDLASDPEFVELGLGRDDAEAFVADA